MLLNTWLTAAKRQFFGSSVSNRDTRRSRRAVAKPTAAEQLEPKTLLTALVINNSNVNDFVDAAGTVSVTNAQLGSHDTVVIEDISLNSTASAISIDLSGVPLARLAIESVNVNAFSGTAIDVNLTNVTGTRTVSIEDINVTANSGAGVDVELDGTDVYALTIEDSVLPGVAVSAINGADITHGIVTENTIDAPQNVEGVLLNVNTGGTADNFQIVNNQQIAALDDAVRVNLDDAPLDGLVIADNNIGNEPGADFIFRAEGDTFNQPFELTNNATAGEEITRFTLDLRPLGLVFDERAVDGLQFTTAPGSSAAVTGAVGTVNPSLNNQVLTIDFTAFAPGETFLFSIDVDSLPTNPTDPPVDFTAFGSDLIGAAVQVEFTGPKLVDGFMIGDPDVLSASQFARGAGAANGFHGVNLDLTGSPLTNASLTGNVVTGVAGHGVFFDARNHSDITAVVEGNQILSGSQDGLRFELLDSDFAGGILDNTISVNGGTGISFLPSVSRTGAVEAALDSNPFIITSTNHQLQTGDQIILQGVVNDDPTINHPANGVHTITRVDNNRFQLQGVDGTAAGVRYSGGGTWYVPDFRDGTGNPSTNPLDNPRGLVSIDVQADEPDGRIQDIQPGGSGQGAIVTSFDHGLASGDRVRISRADGTGISGTETFKITVIDQDTFQLDTQPLIGTYDTSGGLASWTTNVIDTVTETGEIVVTSEAHGLNTGDQIRVVGVVITAPGVTASANGQWTVTRLSEDTFSLQGSEGNGVHVVGTGHWIPFASPTFTGDLLPQLVSGNTVETNQGAGFHVDLQTGTRFNGDIVTNKFTANNQKGIYIESHSFGLGTELPLDPNDPFALPAVQDISFNVNIGTSETDGNVVNQNTQAGIVVEALDFATGKFEVRGNEVNANQDDADALTPYFGDGIVVRLDSDLLSSEAIGFLTESVISDNQIGVDGRGNQGNGLLFEMADRTRIQDLEILDNAFVNNELDGFHFVRTEDGDLNSVVFDDNRATNNSGDGFDIFAENTVKDRLDFRILDSVIDNNGHYGVRADVQADARIQLDIQGSSIRENGADGNGFAPDDGEGTLGESGGVGLHGFQQVDVILDIIETTIERNIGDGLSIDADNFFDTLVMDVSIVDSKLNANSRTGLRSVGSAFGRFDLLRSDFNGNGTDGARFISNEDPDDFFDRRVGGQDLDIYGLGNDFQANAHNGLVIGQGYSSVFGNGDVTEDFANRFGGRVVEDIETFGLDASGQPMWDLLTAGSIAGNGEDGLKIVQDAGPYLRDLDRRRVIQTNANVFTHNTGAGVDIGHFIPLEGGNADHGDEVVSDTDITIENADLSDNGGDGVEYLADNFQRVPPVVGGGQDNIPEPNITSLTISNSDIKNNAERGVDILNRHSEDSRVNLRNNEVIGNGFSGIYIVNTSSRDQLQNGPNDPLAAELWTGNGIPLRTPNIELRIQDNLIESNGTAGRQSTVPINSSIDNNDGVVGAHPDFYHLTDLIEGTLGGITLRVGTTDTSGRIAAAAPEHELSLSGIDAEIWKNNFDGNFGADVYLDNYVSLVPPQSGTVFTITPPADHQWRRGFRDPLSRLDLVFRENTGNSLDVINGFAFYDNQEDFFKRRISNGGAPPNPEGPFSNGRGDRNATRTLGYFSDVGDDPGNTFEWGFQGADELTGIDTSLFNEALTGPYWSYDGWGTPTWRVESDFDFNNFQNTDVVSGLSDFFDAVNLGFGLAEEPYQWDTGINVPGFTGSTPFSLTRGDVFNVQAGETPIQPDLLEENDSFLGATDLGTIAGAGFSVNALTTDNRLTIETKGDRDYYQFAAAGTGNLTLNVDATDANGSDLSFLIYEVDPLRNTNEVPLVSAANGDPVRSTAAAGSNSTLTVPVVAGRTYVVEVLGVETSSVVPSFASVLNAPTQGKSFVYGTARSYGLTIDAPAAAPVVSQPATTPATTVSTQQTVSTPGITAPVSIADAQPSVVSITGPAASVVSVSTNTLTITFTEDVTGVDISDFQLVHNGSSLDLSTAVFSAVALDTYQITNLSPLTLNPGVYQFSLQSQNSNIVDTDLEPIVVSGNESISWTVDNNVNSTVDGTDNIPGDGIFADVNGNRTLRAAIMEANANDGQDLILVTPGTYTLSLAGRFEDAALTGDLDVTGNLTIRGTGATAAETIIDAADVDRVFHVLAGAELTLENLTIRGGEAYDGAGLFVEDNLVILNPDNTVQATFPPAKVSLTDVNLINNEAYNQGGGIYNLGTVDLVRSSISMNVAGSRGGGIFNHGAVDLLNSTVSTNFAVSRGGGIFNETAASAVNDNLAPIQTVATVNAVNATIAFNSAESAGGGLYQEQAQTIRLGNTVFDQNTVSTSTAAEHPELNLSINSLGNNFFGNLVTLPNDALLLGSDIAADQDPSFTDAGLSPLAVGANGTHGHAPAVDAAILDAGSNSLYADETGISATTPEEIRDALLAEFDQFGNPRLVEGNEDGNFDIDIGAVESFVSRPIAVLTVTPNPAGEGEIVTFDGTASTHTLVPGNSRIASYEWDFDYDGNPTNFDVNAVGATTTTTYPTTGSFTVGLRVTDTLGGAQDIAVVQVNISAPSAPVITAPFALGTSDLTPTIEWDAGTGNFSLVVTNLDTNQVVINENNLSTPSFTPAFNLDPGNYEAVVTAINANGQASSQPYQFVVQQIALTDPINHDIEFDTTPQITWTAIPDADRYQLWVSQVSDTVDENGRRATLAIVINDSFIDAGQAQLPESNLAAHEPSTPLDEGFYRTWVRAFDANDNPGHWSAGSQFQVTRPVVTVPAFQGANLVDDTPEITWTDIGANQYQVWLAQINGSVNGVDLARPDIVFNGVVADTTYTAALQNRQGLFRVWVRALADDGEAGLWSTAFDFTKDLRLGPELFSPIGGATQTDRTPVFSWEPIIGAARYEIWVNNASTGQSRVIHATDVPHVDGATSITYTDPTVTLRNATYRWWVRAFNEAGLPATWSTGETFWVPAPSFLTPVNNSTVNGTNLPEFTWRGVPEYVRYEFWLNNLTTSRSRVVYRNDLTTTSFTPELPLENGTFRAWVRGFDADNNASQWTNPVTFTLDGTVGNAPLPVSPSLPGAISGVGPTFVWQPLVGASQYEILVKRIQGNSQPDALNIVDAGTVDQVTGNLSYTSNQNLLSGDYRWWIRGISADNTLGPWSQPLEFTVAAIDAPELHGDGFDTEILLTAFPEVDVFADDVRDITVHPAAVVVAHLPSEDVEPARRGRESAKLEVNETALPQAGSLEVIDDVMQEIAVSDWMTLADRESISNDSQDVSEAASTLAEDATVDSSEAEKTTAAVLALGAFGLRRRRDKDQE